MVTMSLFFILAVAIGAALYFKKVAVGSLILGILFGLSLASTSFGAPVLDGFQSLLNGLVDAAEKMANS